MAGGIGSLLLAQRSVTLLRGRRDGLEVTLSERELEASLEELEARLAEQPGFYRGSSAVVNFGSAYPSPEMLIRVRDVLEAAGVMLRGLAGSAEGLEQLAAAEGLGHETPSEREEVPQKRGWRRRAEADLSEAARSLVPDFAGARGDIAQRRRRGEASVPRVKAEPKHARRAQMLHLVESTPGTLYHSATLRGGQVLHHTGNIVVVGDVNPGAELVATGDIVVFGRLAGIAHAGAGGDEKARIYALELAATQLRIATFIAAEHDGKRRSGPNPEAAVAREGRIAIVPFNRVAELESAGASEA